MTDAEREKQWREALDCDDVVVDATLTMSAAVFSPGRTHRHILTRGCALPGQIDVGLLMLNPSTADAFKNDPTITRGQGFADRLTMERFQRRCRSLVVGNVYGLRSTDPRGLWAATDPVGVANMAAIEWIATNALNIIVAWGANARDADVARVRDALHVRGSDRPVWCLGVTKSGAPRHPLYLAADTPFEPWPRGSRHPDDWFPRGVDL